MDRYDTLLSKFEQGVAKEAFELLDKDNSGTQPLIVPHEGRIMGF